MTTFQGYDMTALLNTPTETKKPIISPFMEKKAPKMAPAKQREDIIQTYINKMELDKHPEVLPQILEEMNLTRFYAGVEAHSNYSIVKTLAHNRMLNFYEGANRGTVTSREVKIGLVVCLMVSTVFADRDNLVFPNTAKNPCILYPRTKCSLSDFDLGSMNALDIEICEKMITYLAKSAKPTESGMKFDGLSGYILNSLKMWILSDDQELLSFVALGGERLKHLKPEVAQWYAVRTDLLYGTIYAYDYYGMVSFTNAWAKSKNIVRNGPDRLKSMRELS